MIDQQQIIVECDRMWKHKIFNNDHNIVTRSIIMSNHNINVKQFNMKHLQLWLSITIEINSIENDYFFYIIDFKRKNGQQHDRKMFQIYYNRLNEMIDRNRSSLFTLSNETIITTTNDTNSDINNQMVHSLCTDANVRSKLSRYNAIHLDQTMERSEYSIHKFFQIIDQNYENIPLKSFRFILMYHYPSNGLPSLVHKSTSSSIDSGFEHFHHLNSYICRHQRLLDPFDRIPILIPINNNSKTIGGRKKSTKESEEQEFVFSTYNLTNSDIVNVADDEDDDVFLLVNLPNDENNSSDQGKSKSISTHDLSTSCHEQCLRKTTLNDNDKDNNKKEKFDEVLTDDRRRSSMLTRSAASIVSFFSGLAHKSSQSQSLQSDRTESPKQTETLFGNSIQLDNQRELPSTIKFLLSTIMKPNICQTEGIFRRPGLLREVRELRTLIESAHDGDHSSWKRLNDLQSQFNSLTYSSVLKQYLRELPDPLLSSSRSDEWISIANTIKEQTAEQLDKQLIIDKIRSQLSIDGTDSPISSSTIMLKYLLSMFYQIAKIPETKMTSDSLAVCVAPTLFKSNPYIDKMAKTMKKNDTKTSTIPTHPPTQMKRRSLWDIVRTTMHKEMDKQPETMVQTNMDNYKLIGQLIAFMIDNIDEIFADKSAETKPNELIFNLTNDESDESDEPDINNENLVNEQRQEQFTEENIPSSTPIKSDESMRKNTFNVSVQIENDFNVSMAMSNCCNDESMNQLETSHFDHSYKEQFSQTFETFRSKLEQQKERIKDEARHPMTISTIDTIDHLNSPTKDECLIEPNESQYHQMVLSDEIVERKRYNSKTSEQSASNQIIKLQRRKVRNVLSSEEIANKMKEYGFVDDDDEDKTPKSNFFKNNLIKKFSKILTFKKTSGILEFNSSKTSSNIYPVGKLMQLHSKTNMNNNNNNNNNRRPSVIGCSSPFRRSNRKRTLKRQSQSIHILKQSQRSQQQKLKIFSQESMTESSKL
ncbi:Dynein light chain Tctex-type [Blomia tropicalis]|nr:Dynein light chain Tctex-type [Blomia tropicalis]